MSVFFFDSSAIARQYHDGQIALSRLQAFRQLFMQHVQSQYLVLALSGAVIYTSALLT